MSVSKGPKDAQSPSQPQFDFDRRNILLSGASLLAMSAVSKAAAQTPPTTPKTEMGPAAPVAAQAAAGKPNILVIWGDDIGIANISAYSNGLDGLRDPEHRPHRQGRHQIPALLRRAILHGGPLGVPHRPAHHSNGVEQGRLPGRADGDEPARSLDRRPAQKSRLRHGSVRQEPRRRSQPLAPHGQWLRRVLRQPLPSQRRGRAGIAGLSEGPSLPRQVRPARRASLQGDRR